MPSGRILSGWMSDHLGRINVLRLMIGISMVAMPILYFVGGNVVGLFVMLFIVYWCYGTQLSVNGATAADFWGTKNVGINYGMLFTAWGVAGLLGGRIGGLLYDKYKTTRWRFTRLRRLAAVALLCELAAKRPAIPQRQLAGEESGCRLAVVAAVELIHWIESATAARALVPRAPQFDNVIAK